ncbi:MAG TPA: hypothetical protein IAB77_07720 [Candidatus Scatomorpha intestinavium]|uniref:Zinc finger CHC2-type domain-containing protein n=1 Tax=Candidatus Scatomorpha intestinavium TaxID=2840922 RepID=A0A9D1CU63_9FIRM|nr:hypothetical protein [Candidatus Scatomorpha intestinavium]
MIDVFREARERVTARDAAQRYGLQLDRAGRALCPFHNDHHPSMSFKHGRFRCWACGANGDSIDLTARLLSLTPVEALGRLNADFGLNLALDREPTAQERKAAERRREVDEAYREFETWREGFLVKLNTAVRAGNEAERKAPDELTDAEVAALQWREAFEHWADELSHGSAEAQAQIYRERGQIARWIDRALNRRLKQAS